MAMNGEMLTSVSKGCFVVKGRKKTKVGLDAGNYLESSKLPSSARWRKGQQMWQDMECQIKDLHLKLTSGIFSDLLVFVKKSISVKKGTGSRHSEIPTAALMTGVNMPDHASLFLQLSDKIKSTLTPHVATLCAKNCTSTRSLMRCIGQQLILGETDDQLNVTVEDVDGDLGDLSKSFTWKRSIPLTMPLLKRWYSTVDHSVNVKTPKKRKKEIQTLSPIILIIQDTEAFVPNVLQDLIVMLSDVLSTLPVILILGVATSWTSVVDRLLSHSATVHLGLEKFHSPSASQHLSVIIDEVLLSGELPFKLGGKCMQLLLDVFLYHDFSVTNFLLLLKFCNMEHFYEEPASIFCTDNAKEMKDLVKSASKELLQHLRTIPSVKSYVSALGTKRKESLKKSENFRNIILEMLLELRRYHEIFFPVMRSLFFLCKSLPRHPLGRHLRELYCACDHASIADTDDYKQAQLLLRVSSRDQLVQRLTACLSEIESLPSNSRRTETQTGNLQDVIDETRNSLRSVIEDLSSLGESQDGMAEEEDEVEAMQDDHKIEKVKYAYQLKEKLQSRHREKKIKKMSAFEKLRMNALDLLDEMYKKVLKPPRTLPLHEAFYFDSASSVKKHMVASPRLAIQTALSNPQYYLQESCLASTDGMIPPLAPDVCIAYKLHNECGRIINLCDWMEAFHTIVTSQDRDDDEEMDEEVDELTQARFIRAASELQFLGFIKPTKKKTDHVQRLTWSHS